MFTLTYSFLLQCALPVFEFMLEDDFDDIVQDMLWESASFHALGRSHAHWTASLEIFRRAVVTLGKEMRKFDRNVCHNNETTELPAETASRQRRKQASSKGKPVSVTPNIRHFNLNTYKYHRLGDYPAAVLEFGPLDVYSTQTVCLVIKRYAEADFRH